MAVSRSRDVDFSRISEETGDTEVAEDRSFDSHKFENGIYYAVSCLLIGKACLGLVIFFLALWVNLQVLLWDCATDGSCKYLSSPEFGCEVLILSKASTGKKIEWKPFNDAGASDIHWGFSCDVLQDVIDNTVKKDCMPSKVEQCNLTYAHHSGKDVVVVMDGDKPMLVDKCKPDTFVKVRHFLTWFGWKEKDNRTLAERQATFKDNKGVSKKLIFTIYLMTLWLALTFLSCFISSCDLHTAGLPVGRVLDFWANKLAQSATSSDIWDGNTDGHDLLQCFRISSDPMAINWSKNFLLGKRLLKQTKFFWLDLVSLILLNHIMAFRVGEGAFSADYAGGLKETDASGGYAFNGKDVPPLGDGCPQILTSEESNWRLYLAAYAYPIAAFVCFILVCIEAKFCKVQFSDDIDVEPQIQQKGLVLEAAIEVKQSVQHAAQDFKRNATWMPWLQPMAIPMTCFWGTLILLGCIVCLATFFQTTLEKLSGILEMNIGFDFWIEWPKISMSYNYIIFKILVISKACIDALDAYLATFMNRLYWVSLGKTPDIFYIAFGRWIRCVKCITRPASKAILAMMFPSLVNETAPWLVEEEEFVVIRDSVYLRDARHDSTPTGKKVSEGTFVKGHCLKRNIEDQGGRTGETHLQTEWLLVPEEGFLYRDILQDASLQKKQLEEKCCCFTLAEVELAIEEFKCKIITYEDLQHQLGCQPPECLERGLPYYSRIKEVLPEVNHETKLKSENPVAAWGHSVIVNCFNDKTLDQFWAVKNQKGEYGYLPWKLNVNGVVIEVLINLEGSSEDEN